MPNRKDLIRQAWLEGYAVGYETTVGGNMDSSPVNSYSNGADVGLWEAWQEGYEDGKLDVG